MRRKNRVHGNNKGGVGKVITGLVVGSVVGATVGLLMAPASGKDTRRKITGEVEGVQRRTKTAVENFGDKAREVAEDVRGNINEGVGYVTKGRKKSAR